MPDIPSLNADPSCRWTIAEYASYQYPPAELAALADVNVRRTDVNVRRTDDGPEGPGMSQGPLSELPLKANDHLMDATRYALHTHFAQVRAAQRTDGWLARWMKAKRA